MALTNINQRLRPTPSTNEDLYECERNFMGNVIATNISQGTVKIRIAMRPLGATLNESHYLIFDYVLPVGSSYTIFGLALNQQDTVTVYADSDCAFNLFGVER